MARSKYEYNLEYMQEVKELLDMLKNYRTKRQSSGWISFEKLAENFPLKGSPRVWIKKHLEILFLFDLFEISKNGFIRYKKEEL